jgi:hypothetical protein
MGMNNATPMDNERKGRIAEGRSLRRVGHVAFGVAYAALFFFLFAIKPAPEQRLQASIGIQASEEEVNGLLKNSTPIRTLPADGVGALLLTKQEATDVTVARQNVPSSNEVILTVETHWQVRGGLLGRALDQVIGRPARESSLQESLQHVKTLAEQASHKTSLETRAARS